MNNEKIRKLDTVYGCNGKRLEAMTKLQTLLKETAVISESFKDVIINIAEEIIYECYDNMKGKTEITKVEFKNIPDCGDLITLQEWIDYVRDGAFIDYDGYGDLALSNKVSNIKVHPSEVFEKRPGGELPYADDAPLKESFINKTKGFTHIVWYNR
jgi:hypothetical protein